MDRQKKIKIAITTRKMIMGGIEKSLIELIKKLLQYECEITLYLEELGGGLYKKIPKEVKVVHVFKEYTSMVGILKKSMRERNIKKMISAGEAYLHTKFRGDPVKSWKATCGYMTKIPKEYDFAFAYGAPVSFSVIFTEQILKAEKKYVWIHNDINQISLDIKKYGAIFNGYQKIVCVSKTAKKIYDELFPEYQNKTMVFYNIIDKEEILEKSKAKGFADDYLGTRILTVGRISDEKGQKIIPDVMQRLLENKYDVKWYCIGDGKDKSSLLDKIKKMSLEDNVILMGSKTNPYPYFRETDIYVQTSRQEGFGITIAEAKFFELPILVTNYEGAEEQITDGETGYIVEYDVEELYKKIVVMIEDYQMRDRIKKKLKDDKKKCVSEIELLLGAVK